MEKNQELKHEEEEIEWTLPQPQTKEEIIRSISEEEILDLTHPIYQSQPYPKENQEEAEVIEEKCTEENQSL